MNNVKKSVSDIAHNHCHYLMNLQNVHGVGYGFKYINKIDTLEPCIHILVENKIDKKYLPSNNIIPKTYMGIKTDVLHVGKFKYLSKDKVRQKFRPLVGGCGISVNKDIGTLGCIVYKVVGKALRYFILSNNHVLADMNANPLGSPVIQPTWENGGSTNGDIIAHLDNFIRIEPFNPNDPNEQMYPPVNFVDAAIAKITNSSLVSNKIYRINSITGLGSPVLNLPVKKVGLVTGLTNGKILTTELSLRTDFKDNDSRRVFYEDQAMAQMTASSGDSGSVTLSLSNEIVGLNFAADLELGHVVMNPIKTVLNYLNVDIYMGDTEL